MTHDRASGKGQLADERVPGSGGIDDVRRLRAAARRDRQEWPFTLMVIGVVVLLAWPFYVFRGMPASRPSVAQVSETLGPLANIGPRFATLGLWAGLYWVVALVVAGLVIAWHDRRAATRRGIAGPLWPVVAAGLVLLVAMLALTPRILDVLALPARAELSTGPLPTGLTLSLRGLTPLLVVALVLVVLAWTERSAPLAGIAAVYLALALVVNLSDLPGNHVGMPAMGRYDLLPSLLVPGTVLLVTGAVATGRRRAGR